MLNKFRHLFTSVLFFIFVVSGMVVVVAAGSEAWGQGCQVTIQKVARGDQGEEFEFDIDLGGTSITEFLSNGETDKFGINPGGAFTFVEVVPVGWNLEAINCDASGTVVTRIENGIILDCVDPTAPETICTFVNVRPASIPTLSEWGMIAAAAGLMLVGVFFVIRRRKAALNS